MFLVVGKFAFIWFSKTVNYAANNLVNNAGLIGRMDMPKTLFPVAVILECSYRQLAFRWGVPCFGWPYADMALVGATPIAVKAC